MPEFLESIELLKTLREYLQWLLEPSVSLLGVGIATFVAAFAVLLIVRRFGKLKAIGKEIWKATKRSLARAFLIAGITCTMLFLWNYCAGKGGDKPGTNPQGGITSTPAKSPILHQIDIVFDFQKRPDFIVTFQEKKNGKTETLKQVSGNVASLWQEFEKELGTIKKQKSDGNFLFTLHGVESAQVEEDCRRRLKTVFAERLEDKDIDVIFLVLPMEAGNGKIGTPILE